MGDVWACSACSPLTPPPLLAWLQAQAEEMREELSALRGKVEREEGERRAAVEAAVLEETRHWQGELRRKEGESQRHRPSNPHPIATHPQDLHRLPFSISHCSPQTSHPSIITAATYQHLPHPLIQHPSPKARERAAIARVVSPEGGDLLFERSNGNARRGIIEAVSWGGEERSIERSQGGRWEITSQSGFTRAETLQQALLAREQQQQHADDLSEAWEVPNFSPSALNHLFISSDSHRRRDMNLYSTQTDPLNRAPDPLHTPALLLTLTLTRTLTLTLGLCLSGGSGCMAAA